MGVEDIPAEIKALMEECPRHHERGQHLFSLQCYQKAIAMAAPLGDAGLMAVLLWHAGRVAIRERRHFRCLYDLAERVYPEGPVASRADYEDTWLMSGLSGCGSASERHLTNYFTAPTPKAADRKRVLARGGRCTRGGGKV